MDDVANKHKTKIAKQTLKYSDAGAMIMGGMSKDEAREHLKKMGHSEQDISKMEESVKPMSKEDKDEAARKRVKNLNKDNVKGMIKHLDKEIHKNDKDLEEGTDETILMQGLDESEGEHSVYKYFPGESRFDHVKKHSTKEKALEQASRLNKNDPDDMHTYVVKKTPIKEEQIPQHKSLLDNIRERNHVEAKPVIKNMLFQKVGQYINKIRPGIANESFLDEMHHEDVQVGQKVMIHDPSNPTKPKKMGTVHMVDNRPSHRFGAKMVHVKDEEGNVKIHLPSSLEKVHESTSDIMESTDEPRSRSRRYSTATKKHQKKNETIKESISSKNMYKSETNVATMKPEYEKERAANFGKVVNPDHVLKKDSYDTFSHEGKNAIHSVMIHKDTKEKSYHKNGNMLPMEKNKFHSAIENHFGI